MVRKRKLKAEDREKRQNDKNELHELKAKHETLLKALEVAGVRTEIVDGCTRSPSHSLAKLNLKG